jgi:ATP-dependent helicase/nuclease subunit B
MCKPSPLILTPTARLARSVLRRLAAEQIEQGLASWRAPTVLSFSAWLAQLRDEWLLDGDQAGVPIRSPQALVLWQSVIDHDIFIGEPRVAELAQSAWRTIHEHDLPRPHDWESLWMSEDQRRFRAWADRYKKLLDERGLVDEWSFAARLPALIRQGRIDYPDRVTLCGFDLPTTALQNAVFDALADAGCEIQRESGEEKAVANAAIIEFDTPDGELLAAAGWAREQLEQNPEAAIGIVVPDLKGRLERVESLFGQVFDPPGFALKPASARAWHVSLGHPLARWPLIDDALGLLALNPARISQPDAGRLLRSPFLTGWSDEALARDRIVARLAHHAPYWIPAGELMHQASHGQAARLGRKLAEWQALRRKQDSRLWPSEWVRCFQQELSALGFGHGRPLDSREYQALQRWHELLEEFSTLDLVMDQPLNRHKALQRLGERTRTAIFRERNPGAAVEVLGVEEALGERFDVLWITALDSEHWPGPSRRDPLIPARLQANLPQGSSDTSLARARQELTALMRISEHVIGSYARGDGDQPLSLTALLDSEVRIAKNENTTIAPITPERIENDSHAPPLEGEQSPGGTGVLQHQSDCPFKAFAVWRLGADDIRPPRPGLDARARGSLLHLALEQFWRELPDQTALLSLDDAKLEARIDQAVQSAMADWQKRQRLALSPAGQQLEGQCLARAMGRWLALEKTREPFTIKRLEEKISMQLGALRLTGKIDRIDELEGGGELLIDYKTGKASRNDWVPDKRPANLQMPAYAVSLNPKPAGLAFAQLRPDSMKFEGLAEIDPGVEGVAVIGQISRKPYKEVSSWQALLTDWATNLEALAGQFIEGRAEVDPRGPDACRYCHLHTLCRIHERSGRMMEENNE